MKLSDVTARVLEKYYMQLLKTPSVHRITQKEGSKDVIFVAPPTVRKVHNVLRSAFHQAVKWELMEKNPAMYATVPKAETKKREIWDAPTLFHARGVHLAAPTQEGTGKGKADCSIQAPAFAIVKCLSMRYILAMFEKISQESKNFLFAMDAAQCKLKSDGRWRCPACQDLSILMHGRGRKPCIICCLIRSTIICPPGLTARS